MTDKKNLSIPSQGSLLRDFIVRVRLLWALMKDGRVSAWLKLIPIVGVVYLVMPIDLVSEIAVPLIGELDDAAVLWLTSYMFMELCPPEVVREHLRALTAGRRPVEDSEVVEAESVEIKDLEK